jgi:hypothetical protein
MSATRKVRKRPEHTAQAVRIPDVVKHEPATEKSLKRRVSQVLSVRGRLDEALAKANVTRSTSMREIEVAYLATVVCERAIELEEEVKRALESSKL